MSDLIIAIDGPAASGKSTVAKGVAKALGFTYLDTGAMYRALTWEVLRSKIDLSNSKSLVELAKNMKIYFKREDSNERVFIDMRDVTEEIRKPEVTNLVSIVSKVPLVRKAMVDKQRDFEEGTGLVAEGRDIGTVVFPKAQIKVYLNASLQERARRRQLEWKRKGHFVSLKEIEADIERRDRIDSTREESPLAKAKNAIEISTTNKTVQQVIEEVIELARGKTTV